MSKFPVPDSYFERLHARYGYYYVDAWYEQYASYLAALSRLGWAQ